MAALTENIAYETRRIGKVVYPVAANVRIFKGSLLTIAGGFAKPGAPEAGAVFGGVASEPADNSGGAGGDTTVEGLTDLQFLAEGSGFTQASVGLDAYVADSGSVKTTAGTNAVYCGRVVQFVSTTQVWVDPRLPKTV